jgi:hypothetical protein
MGTVLAARVLYRGDSTPSARVGGSGKKTQALITMLVERDYRGIG